MKIYLDTNVILDFLLDSRGAFHEPATEVMRLVAAGKITAGFSTSQATDLYFSLRKAVGDTSARDALRNLFALCELFTTPESACIEALDMTMRDYEDAVQALTARHHGCDVILTRNLRDYQDSPVQPFAPKNWLLSFSQNEK